MAGEEDDGIGAIDRIYELLDMVDKDANELEGVRHKSVHVYRYAGIFEAVEFLGELGFCRAPRPTRDRSLQVPA